MTVAGGTSILPVSGYVLYEFLPVEEMFEVAEAVVRVFHRFGDYEHLQRNRMKFTIKALGWDGFRAPSRRRSRSSARGRRALPFDPDARHRRSARLDPAEPPTLQAVAARRARR